MLLAEKLSGSALLARDPTSGWVTTQGFGEVKLWGLSGTDVPAVCVCVCAVCVRVCARV